MKDETKHFPGDQFEVQAKIDTRKSSFGKLARLMTNSGTAWPTSYPGLSWMSFDALDSSMVPAKLKALGYDPVCEGDGERILAFGLTERLTRTSSGALEPATEGSTKPIELRHHAGVTAVKRYTFDL